MGAKKTNLGLAMVESFLPSSSQFSSALSP